jgi:NitT/TauT family transport system substrate-binding protein
LSHKIIAMMRKKVCTTRYFLMVVFAGFVVLGSSVVTEAQNRVRTAYSSTSGIFTPVWIATEERLYQKYQLDVDSVYISGSSVTVSALIAGEIDFIYGGADPIVSAILAGADLTLPAFISYRTPISLYVAPGIGQVEELKGKTVAVGRLASSVTYMLKVCLAQHRMAIQDVALVQAGGYPESVLALQSGRVQGAMLAPPFTYKAQALGFRRIWDGSGVEYPSFVIATRKSVIRNNADKAQQVFNAVAHGVHIFKTDKERAIRVMAKYTKVQDRTILENTYADNKDVHTVNMRPTAAGIRVILDVIAASNQKAAGAIPEQFFDTSLSRRFEESGVINKF